MSAAKSSETIDLSELRTRKVAELAVLLQDKKRAYHDARFALRAGQSQKPNVARQARRDVARVATVLKTLEAAAVKAGQA